MTITGATKVCMIIGDPVRHSLSPLMHNAAYEALDIAHEYIFVPGHVPTASLPLAVQGIRALSIRGASVTMPHKEMLFDLLDSIDDTARSIGAINTIVNDAGHLTGYNTDWLGIVTPLELHGPLAGKKTAIVGAGGAARAACFGLLKKGAQVTLYNRTFERAAALAERAGCGAQPLTDSSNLEAYDIIINATSVGMAPDSKASPIPATTFRRSQIVFDTIYRPRMTTLLRESEHQGATIIDGLEMLLWQGVAQFRLYTGLDAPPDVMRDALTGADNEC